MKDIDKHTIPSILGYPTTEQRNSMWDQIKAQEFVSKFGDCELTKNEPYQDKQTFVTFLAGFSDADLKTLQAQLGFPPDATSDTKLVPRRSSMKSPKSPGDAHVSVSPSLSLATHPLPPMLDPPPPPPPLTRSKRSRSVPSVSSDDDPPPLVHPAYPHYPPMFPGPALAPNMPMPQYPQGYWGPQYPMPMQPQPMEYMHPPAHAAQAASSHDLPPPPPVQPPAACGSAPSSRELADLSTFGHYRRYATKGECCCCMFVF